MVDHADGKGPPPPVLRLAWQCDKYRALPEAGGVLDQEAGLLALMEKAKTLFEVWRAWQAREAGHEGEWAEAHPAQWKIVMAVLEVYGNRTIDPRNPFEGAEPG